MKRILLVLAFVLAAGAVVIARDSSTTSAASTILVGDPFSNPDGVFPYTCGSPANPCDTIQHGVDTATAGDILDIAAGPYNENVVINKRLTLDGAGSSGIGTVVTAAAGGSPTITIQGDAATGTSVTDRLVLKDMRVTGATGGSGNNNSGILVTGSGSTRWVTFDNIAAVSNTGNGIAFNHTGSVFDVDVLNSDLSTNGNAGFRINSGIGSFNDLLISGGTMNNNAINGVQTGASGSPTVTNVTIDGVSFNGNGTATSGGDGDISLFKFNGNATIKDVTIVSDSHIGLQLRGNDPVVTPSGTVVIDNVDISGSARFGLSIIGYSDVSGITFQNGTHIHTTSNWGLYLENLGTVLNIGDTEIGTNLVASIGNVSASDVDATSAVFTGTTNGFVIADRILDGIDAPGGGAVFYEPNEVFVTTNSFAPPLSTTPSIQRGIDAVAANGIVNVQAGTWNSPLVITTPGLELRGAQAGIDPRPGCAPGSQTVQRRSIDVSADNVVIDGLTVAEVGSDGVAPGPVGPANPDSLGVGIYLRPVASGYQIVNNVIRDNIFGLYLNAGGGIPSLVEHNCFIRNNEPGAASGDGIYSDQGLTDATVSENKFTQHTSAAIVLAGTQSDIDITNNESANDSGIVLFNTTNATVTGNTVSNPAGSAIVVGGGNNNVDVISNTVTGEPFRGVRIGDLISVGPNANVEVANNNLNGTGTTARGVDVASGGISSGLDIHDNVLKGHLVGIDVDGANGAQIVDNDVSQFSGPTPDSRAIRVQNSTGINVATNIVNGAHTGSCVGGYWGIYLFNASGAVTGNDVSGIGNGLTTGCQEGRAIEADGSGTLNITNNVVDTYQKSGIIVRGTVNSTVSGNTTTGEGPSNIIAQNGITVTSSGTAMISGNHTSGHRYVPQPTQSCGIITLNTATITGNDSTLDETGICAIGGNGSQVTNNQIDKHTQQGILVDSALNILVDGNDIDGQGNGTTASAGTTPDDDTRYYGVFAVSSTGTISDNIIHGIKHGVSNGIQSGVGIRLTARSGESSDMDITGNTVFDIQKNGMTITNFYGGTVNADVVNNDVSGNGPINYIAQNGIQMSNGATGTIVDNDLSGYDYTPFTAAAIGILTFTTSGLVIDGNTVHDNMEGLYVQDVQNVTVTDNIFTNNYDAAIFTYLSSNGSYSGNRVFGTPTSFGMYFYDTANNNNVTGNAFRNGDYGVLVDYTGPNAPLSNNFDSNCIAGNATAGMATNGTQVGGPIDAENNWWGKVNGPNPPGNGDAIVPAADIDASPFLVAPVAGCPVPADGDGDGINDPQDNCPTVNNPSQENTNGEPMLLPKPTPVFNDVTNPAGDTDGDACDPDIDGDSVLNSNEGPNFLSPYVWDTDGDRVNDGTEIACGSNPLQATSTLSGTDTDHDRLPDACEVIYGTNPNNVDSDGDSVTDGSEVRYWMSNPLAVNTDGDSCNDAREVASVNLDRVVNSIDLAIIASAFGQLPPEFRPYDTDGNGTINSIDLAFVASKFGPCP